MAKSISFSLSAEDIEKVCHERHVHLQDLGLYTKKLLLSSPEPEFDIDEFLRSHSLFELTEMRSKALSKPTWKSDEPSIFSSIFSSICSIF